MCGDIFAATLLWRGSLLTTFLFLKEQIKDIIITGHCLPASCCRGCGGRDVGFATAGRSEAWACPEWHCHLPAGFQQCKSFVKMCTVRCCPLWHPTHCPMGTVPRVLVRRTASPAHADFGGLSSGAVPVVVRHNVVSFLPSSSA